MAWVSLDPTRLSLDASQLNATIKESLVSDTTIKIPPFTGEEDPNEWIADFEMMADAATWDNDVVIKKFPMYLRGGAACWLRSNYFKKPNVQWDLIKRGFVEHFSPPDYNMFLNQRMNQQKQRINDMRCIIHRPYGGLRIQNEATTIDRTNDRENSSRIGPSYKSTIKYVRF